MSDGKGYLIPENAQPDELDCVRVYYPKDSFYLRALIGSLSYLGTWTAWERDEEKRGRLAAIAWKDANDRTFDELHLGCGEDCPECPDDCELCEMTKDELAEIIQQELENMSVTIYNNNCGCGCGCSGSAGSADLTPVISPEIPPNEFEESGEPPTQNPSEAQKCSVCNYLVYALRLTLLRSVDHTGNVTDFNDWYLSLWEGIKEQVSVWVDEITFGLFSWLMAKLNSDSSKVGAVSSAFDEHFNYYVCQLHQASDEQNAYQRLYVALSSTMTDEDVKSSALSIASKLPFQLLFAEPGSITIPAGFENRSCCGTEYVSDFPPILEGDCLGEQYAIHPVNVTNVTHEDDIADPYLTLDWSFTTDDKILDVVSQITENCDYSTPGLDIYLEMPQYIAGVLGVIVQVIENESTSTGMSVSGFNLNSEIAPYWVAWAYPSNLRTCVENVMTEAGITPVGGVRDFGGQVMPFGDYKWHFERDRPSSGSTEINMKLRFYAVVSYPVTG